MRFGGSLQQRVALALALAFAGVGCGAAEKKPEEKRAAEPGPPRKVQLESATEREMAQVIRVIGTLGAQDQAVLSIKVPGRVASVPVDLGTKVSKGQTVAQIETADYQLRVEQASSALGQARALLGLPPDGDDAAVDVEKATAVKQARATLDEAQANLERSRTLSEKKLIGRADLDTANANFLRAESAIQSAREEIYNRQAVLRQRKSELALARQQLADTTIRSPFDGIVQARQASVGEFLPVGAPVATLVRIDPLRLRVEVPERDASNVEVGQIVRVTVDQDEQSYEGKVARLSPIISEQNRTLIVEAEIPNPGSLRPGSFVRGEILTGSERRVTVVPTRAVIVFAGIEKVITVEAGKAVEKQITTGRHDGEWIEVVKGVEPGERVVVEPGNLQQGQPVALSSEAAR